MIARHVAFTKQRVRRRRFSTTLADQPFVKVMPRDYKRVLQAEAKARAENREPDSPSSSAVFNRARGRRSGESLSLVIF